MSDDADEGGPVIEVSEEAFVNQPDFWRPGSSPRRKGGNALMASLDSDDPDDRLKVIPLAMAAFQLLIEELQLHDDYRDRWSIEVPLIRAGSAVMRTIDNTPDAMETLAKLRSRRGEKTAFMDAFELLNQRIKENKAAGVPFE